MDVLSRLPLINSDKNYIDITREHLAKSYNVDKIDSNTFRLTYQMIDKHQHKYKELVEKLKRANYHTKYFRWGKNKFMLIYKNDKIVVPTMIWKYAVNWYHTYLLHPGTEHTDSVDQLEGNTLPLTYRTTNEY